MFDEASMMKPTNSQQVESGQIKEVSQRVESDVTSRTLDSLVSFEFSPKITHDEDYVADEDTERCRESRITDGSNLIFYCRWKNQEKST